LPVVVVEDEVSVVDEVGDSVLVVGLVSVVAVVCVVSEVVVVTVVDVVVAGGRVR